MFNPLKRLGAGSAGIVLSSLLMLAPSPSVSAAGGQTASRSIRFVPQTFATPDGIRLRGHLALPLQNARASFKRKRFPVVLLLAGSGATNRYENVPAQLTSEGKPALLFKPLEDALIRQGVAVFAYDKRGILPSEDFRTNRIDSRLFQSATATTLASDALAAFDYLSSLPEIDPSRILVLGHSEGTVLALKIAERRAKSVRGLFYLGAFTRSFRELSAFQSVEANLRVFGVMDADRDGFVSRKELDPFYRESPMFFPSWEVAAQHLDSNHDSRIAQREWQSFFERRNREFWTDVKVGSGSNSASEHAGALSRQWYQEYEQERELMPRHRFFCSRIHVFHGMADMQTPIEDMIALRDECAKKRAPLADFRAYPGLGHGFSPRNGLRQWHDTIGPMSTAVAEEIAKAARASLRARIRKSRSASPDP